MWNNKFSIVFLYSVTFCNWKYWQPLTVLKIPPWYVKILKMPSNYYCYSSFPLSPSKMSTCKLTASWKMAENITAWARQQCTVWKTIEEMALRIRQPSRGLFNLSLSFTLILNSQSFNSPEYLLVLWDILRCTRPPQSQSGAIFCHLNHHCVVFNSGR